MKIRNVNSVALVIEATGEEVEPGEDVEVDSELGASLLEQPRNWARPNTKRGKEKPDRAALRREADRPEVTPTVESAEEPVALGVAETHPVDPEEN